jgi:hypothetical protein
MIGYYVHHQGSGHLHRALAVAAELTVPVTGLSSLPRPPQWAGDWLQLPADDLGTAPEEATAGGHLHWVPLDDEGVRDRAAALSAWIATSRPALLVADVSVEVALLARLHGVRVVSLVMPGSRGDRPHQLGYGVSSALWAAWPPAARDLARDLVPADRARVTCVGGVSRFPVRPSGPRRPGPPRVTALLGDGGGQPGAAAWEDARAQTPDWEWTVLGRALGTWTSDPYAAICDADVVVTHAGQGAIADVAASRRPAVVIPADRPYGEQRATAEVLAAGGWPVRVEQTFPISGWRDRLEQVARLDGSAWSGWTDGHAASRVADLLLAELARARARAASPIG